MQAFNIDSQHAGIGVHHTGTEDLFESCSGICDWNHAQRLDKAANVRLSFRYDIVRCVGLKEDLYHVSVGGKLPFFRLFCFGRAHDAHE